MRFRLERRKIRSTLVGQQKKKKGKQKRTMNLNNGGQDTEKKRKGQAGPVANSGGKA